MDTKDFRIGNYVMDNVSGEWMIIEDLTVKDIGAALIDRSKYPLPDGWKMTCIPISTKVLEMLGFKRGKGVWWIDDMDIIELKDGYYSLLVKSEYDEGEPFKYVHELQNIYKDLYHKELVFNPAKNKLSEYDHILAKVEEGIESDFVTPRFGNRWKDNADKNYDREMLLDIAWKNGRRVVLLEMALKEVLEKQATIGCDISKDLQIKP